MNKDIKTIEFYCKKCKRTFRAFHIITGDDNTPVMQNFTMKCHHCNRIVMLKNYSEGKVIEKTKLTIFYL